MVLLQIYVTFCSVSLTELFPTSGKVSTPVNVSARTLTKILVTCFEDELGLLAHVSLGRTNYIPGVVDKRNLSTPCNLLQCHDTLFASSYPAY